MNILYVITKSERGGAQQHVRDLAIGFHKAGHDVRVAIGEKDGWLSSELRAQSVPVESTRLLHSWNPFVFVIYLFDLFRVIQRVHPDTVHFHSSHTLVGTWIIRLCFPRVRSVVTIHGLSLLYPGVAKKSVQRVYRYFIKIVLACADQVICVCVFDRDILCRMNLVRSDRVIVIHNGIDTPLFLSKTEARSKIGLPQDVIVIGTLARFSFQKNISFLIDAFAAWNHPTARLCLIGSGPEELLLKQRVREKQIEDRVVFHQGDATLLKAFSVYVLSSRYEGFPYTLLEAALADVPIVATDVGGVSELIEQNKTGWLLPSEDRKALIHALQKVISLDAQEIHTCVQQAHAVVQTTFTRERCLEEVFSTYSQ